MKAQQRTSRQRVRVGAADELQRVSQTLELACCQCGRRGVYDVGLILYDPGVEFAWERVAFANYFHCRHCGSAGPWRMASAAQLMRLASPALLTRSGYFCPCVPLLFDGTFAQTPAMGEDHLRRLLEADPNNAFLWTRLGNLLRTCCQCAAASAAYVKALALDPGDLEARYHLYRFAAEDDDTAGWLNHARLLIRYFHEGRRCQDEDLSEGIALKVLDDLLKAPADRRSQLPHCPDGSARPREAAFLAAMFAAPGEPRAILESAFECLMAGKDFALAR